ncbi:MAG TPA: hypothetical protein VNT30_10100 [Stellaceae bacterium]|nr:hypothetical protein [Stellaceae bacterium]
MQEGAKKSRGLRGAGEKFSEPTGSRADIQENRDDLPQPLDHPGVPPFQLKEYALGRASFLVVGRKPAGRWMDIPCARDPEENAISGSRQDIAIGIRAEPLFAVIEVGEVFFECGEITRRQARGNSCGLRPKPFKNTLHHTRPLSVGISGTLVLRV